MKGHSQIRMGCGCSVACLEEPRFADATELIIGRRGGGIRRLLSARTEAPGNALLQGARGRVLPCLEISLGTRLRGVGEGMKRRVGRGSEQWGRGN